MPPGAEPGGCPVTAATWRRLAKATAARRLVGLLVLLVLPAGSGAVLEPALADPVAGEPAWRAAARPVLGLGGLVVAIVLVAGTLVRDVHRRRLVAAHDGRIDPRSLARLPDGPGADAARAYWWTWLVTAEPPGVFAARTASGPGRTLAAARAAVREELAVPAALLLLVPAAVAVLAERSVVTTGIVPAAALATLALVRCLPWLTVSAEPPLRRCGRCDQPLVGGIDRCPECGTRHPSGELRAARPRPARRVAEGLVAVTAVCWLAGVLAGGPLTRVLRTSFAVPTAALVTDLGASARWDERTFRALITRGPNATEARDLAEGLLQRRRAGVPVGAEAWAWFEHAVSSGLVPAALESERWRDAVELRRVIVARHAPPTRATGGGVPFRGPSSPPASDPARDAVPAIAADAGPGGTPAADAPGAGPWLALRFARRMDPGDARRVGMIVTGLEVGDGPPVTPRRADGSLCLIASGERPLRARWLPRSERQERPWPAPPEYVLALPPVPPGLADRVAAGEPVTIHAIRFVTAADADAVGVTWTPFGLRLTGPVQWQDQQSITLETTTGLATATATPD